MVAREVDAAEVDVHLRVPDVLLHGRRAPGCRVPDAGYEDVDAPVRRHAGRHQRLHGRRRRRVRGDDGAPPPFALDGRPRLRRRGDRPVPAEDHGALAREHDGAGGADAPALGPGLAHTDDKRDLALEIVHRGCESRGAAGCVEVIWSGTAGEEGRTLVKDAGR